MFQLLLAQGMKIYVPHKLLYTHNLGDQSAMPKWLRGFGSNGPQVTTTHFSRFIHPPLRPPRLQSGTVAGGPHEVFVATPPPELPLPHDAAQLNWGWRTTGQGAVSGKCVLVCCFSTCVCNAIIFLPEYSLWAALCACLVSKLSSCADEGIGNAGARARL